MKPPPIEYLCDGNVVYRINRNTISLLATDEYHALIRAFGGKQKRPGGRWVISRREGEMLIEQLRRFVPLR
jgi:hypothetical protein